MNYRGLICPIRIYPSRRLQGKSSQKHYDNVRYKTYNKLSNQFCKVFIQKNYIINYLICNYIFIVT